VSKQQLKQQRLSLSRMLAYVLGHRPDEFGLLPDESGYVRLKDLLTALKEEEGWSFVRESHIQDLLRESADTRFELKENMIRVAPEHTALVLGPYRTDTPPALLYHAVRNRAYAHAYEHGLVPAGGPWVSLYMTPEAALRVARRRDPEPILLMIQAARAHQKGVTFFRPFELVYLAAEISPAFFFNPPQPKERPEREKKKPSPPSESPTPGSFFLDFGQAAVPPWGDKDRGSKKPSKEKDWKRATRKMRRERGR
jgi:putative RNA 2'-phosphotransferase